MIKMVTTKFGRQPFMDMILAGPLTMREAARKIGVPWLHFRHAGYGYVVPKYELRDGLAKFLGKPVEDLFTAEVLAIRPHYGARARAQMQEAKEGS